MIIIKTSDDTISAHKNIVAFITHCGIGGVYEGLHSGVPMVLSI